MLGTRTYHAQLVTPAGVKFDGQVDYVRLPGVDGYFGVMADHAPLIAALAPGRIVVTPGQGARQVYAAGGGVVEINDNKLVALVDTLETPEEIDLARAREAAERARDRLAGPRRGEIDPARAEAALARALVRLKVASEHGRVSEKTEE
jgi:F-type H+-transporting ATPase subunit epsilon